MQIYSITSLFQTPITKELSFTAVKPTINNSLIKPLESDVVQIKKKLSPKKRQMLKREQKVLELSMEGKTQKEIGETVGLDISMVNKIARKFDAFQQRKIKRNEEIIQRMINGESRKELAKEYGVSQRTIEKIADANKTFKKYIENRDEKIMSLLKEGYLAKEIAEMMGISDSTVSRTAHKHGLYLRKKKSILKK